MDSIVFIDVKYLIILGIIALAVLWFVFMYFIYAPIKAYIFGYKVYQYRNHHTNFYSKYNKSKVMWHKTDEEALKHMSSTFYHMDIVYPNKHAKKISYKPNGPWK